ncbi:MAG: glucose-6-phosphate dehydrogenase [Eubacteriales bacterium]|nr:glucose-6-phosphate dehydrogenase [Eubacteriales bacterium]
MDNTFVFVIFGSTGDLATNKLIPAFYHLIQDSDFSTSFRIIAIGRREYSTEGYLSEIHGTIANKVRTFNDEIWRRLSESVKYLKMDLTDQQDYKLLEESLLECHNNIGTRNTIYYFATAPEFFPLISQNLVHYGLNKLETGYQRVVIEKPFGYDLATATYYNQTLNDAFSEESIFRIDHFLGKEMIQNIFYLRFTNIVFEKVWDHHCIKSVQIIVDEESGIENRGNYYDKSGALRDMVQNHLLQMLALVGMDSPDSLSEQNMVDKKLKVLDRIRISDEIVLGQYRGYTDERDILPGSSTETFVALKCFIENDRWNNTPFFLRTGKKLDSKATEIIIEFKDNEGYMSLGNIKNNVLVIKVQPEEGLYFRFNAKQPGVMNRIQTNALDYCQTCNIAYRSPEAYEKLLGEITKGDQTLFSSWRELEISWRIIDQIAIKKSSMTVHTYDKGSNGPAASDLMMRDNNTTWMKDVFI